MITDKDLELIFRYIDNTINEEDKRMLEEKIKNDPDFAKEVTLQKEIATSLHNKDKISEMELLISSLESNKKIPNEKNIFQIPIFRFGIAAAILLLIIFSATFLYLNYTQPRNNEALFSEYYEPYTDIPDNTLRSDTLIINSLNDAFIEYHKKNYQKALYLFEQELSSNPNNTIAIFFAAQCNLNLSNYPIAIGHFQNVIKSKTYYLEEARWYLALSYLKENKKKRAKNLLKKLSSSKNRYSSKAEEILKVI